MCLAALVDAGVPLDYLHTKLSSLGLDDEFTLSVTPLHRRGLRALHAQVNLTPPAAEPVTKATPPAVALPPEPGHIHASPGHGHDHDHRHEPNPDHSHPQATATRNLPEIERLIAQANLPDRACRWSLAVFRCLAEAEAAVHGIAVEQVHFHEVGATDAIV